MTEENADHRVDAEPWHPMSSPRDLKHLTKLVEELGECIAAAGRCMAQGINEREPVTGKVNKEWLEDEFADVTANMVLVIVHFKLNEERMVERTKKKMERLNKWHEHA